jgi:hypothetical protein
MGRGEIVVVGWGGGGGAGELGLGREVVVVAAWWSRESGNVVRGHLFGSENGKSVSHFIPFWT